MSRREGLRLALVLFAYVITGIYIRPPWSAILHATFVPSVPAGRDAWATLVAILGTTISPYLFFWQASQEVEEEKALGRHTLVQRRGASPKELLDRKIDVGVGKFFSNLVMFFIILTAAFILHVPRADRIGHLATGRAEALRPLTSYRISGSLPRIRTRSEIAQVMTAPRGTAPHTRSAGSHRPCAAGRSLAAGALG